MLTCAAVTGPKAGPSSIESFERFTGLSAGWGGWATATFDHN